MLTNAELDFLTRMPSILQKISDTLVEMNKTLQSIKEAQEKTNNTKTPFYE
jgi:hypothetical protein